MFPCDMLEIPYESLKVDMIYASWGFGYLDDDDVVTMLDRAKPSLYNGHSYGIIILKENNR